MSSSAFQSAPNSPHQWTGQWFDFVCHIGRLARSAQKELGPWLEKTGLNELQFLILWSIHRRQPEGVAQSHLVEALAVSKAQVSQHLESLRQLELVVADRSPADRRCLYWRSTPAGDRLAETLAGQLHRTAPAPPALVQDVRRLTELLESPPGETALRIVGAEDRP